MILPESLSSRNNQRKQLHRQINTEENNEILDLMLAWSQTTNQYTVYAAYKDLEIWCAISRNTWNDCVQMSGLYFKGNKSYIFLKDMRINCTKIK